VPCRCGNWAVVLGIGGIVDWGLRLVRRGLLVRLGAIAIARRLVEGAVVGEGARRFVGWG